MVFSSIVFLWVFLPIVLLGNYFVKDIYRNAFLLFASLVFYAWGEPQHIVVMLFSIAINYVLALLIDKNSGLVKSILFISDIFINLLLLFVFKYLGFILGIIQSLFCINIYDIKIALPIGISFYTFQILSYVVDVYRGDVYPQKNILDLGLYVALFPQLIAGPIVKYKDIQSQLTNRICDMSGVAVGIQRFSIGLGKKVLIANVLAGVVDKIFAQDVATMGTKVLWIGAVSYTLQIYFDFSGYSDMAIGIGRMLGFRFMENFNYPYISSSVQEFWKRWHISLSTWFKEYLYIPLGGNRKGKYRTYRNLFIVFLTTGIWHGANWTFLVWGIYYGFFLILERVFLGKWLKKIGFFRHIYSLTVIIVGWVVFRADNLGYAFSYIKHMFVLKSGTITNSAGMFLNRYIIVVLVFGILFSGFVQKIIKPVDMESISIKSMVVSFLLLGLSVLEIASGAYNPFIYFRF